MIKERPKGRGRGEPSRHGCPFIKKGGDRLIERKGRGTSLNHSKNRAAFKSNSLEEGRRRGKRSSSPQGKKKVKRMKVRSSSHTRGGGEEGRSAFFPRSRGEKRKGPTRCRARGVSTCRRSSSAKREKGGEILPRERRKNAFPPGGGVDLSAPSKKGKKGEKRGKGLYTPGREGEKERNFSSRDRT